MPPSRLISVSSVAVAPARAMSRTALFPWAVGPRSALSPAQAAPPAGQLPSTIRSGAGHWLRSLHRMLRFDLRRARQWALMMAVAQVFMGAGWLFAIHRLLPFHNMAVVIRAGLSVGLVSDLTRSFLVLGAWTVAGWALTGWVIGTRR